VKAFIQEAQVNYRTFFSSREPDLFPRIIERLTSEEAPQIYDINSLRRRVQDIHLKAKQNDRLGLEADRWDFPQLMAQLDKLAPRSGEGLQQALTVLGSYVEQLESRAAERGLVADRLLTFEALMKEFIEDKTVLIDPKLGFKITTASGQALEEHQLSSGEFHLLFLMVASLVTRRRGTVIAIDEPEMSMHLAWQRALIPALVRCASNAQPLFIFATHSPDLAASYPEALKRLM
jgi:predicted ATPase